MFGLEHFTQRTTDEESGMLRRTYFLCFTQSATLLSQYRKWVPSRPTLIIVCQAMLAVTALCNVRILRHVAKYYKGAYQPGADIASYEEKLAEVKAVLPEDAIVGYDSDRDGGLGGISEFYAIRYALAPIRVVRRSDRSIVVGRFDKAPLERSSTSNKRLLLIRDFGNGVQLFQTATGR